MILGSKQHTVGDIKRWVIDYCRWLDNTATLKTAVVTSSSATCTVTSASILGTTVIFFLNGGVLNETLTVSVVITDSLGNTKHDTIAFTVLAP